MTPEELQHIIDVLSTPPAEPRHSQMYAEPVQPLEGYTPGVYHYAPGTYHIDRDEAYMAERDWLKKAFMGTYLDGTEQIADRHPEFQRHCSGLWPKRRPRCDRYERPTPSAPQELTVGDTSQLDAFLGGFAGAKK